VFGYAATFDLKNVPFAVYNEDHGVASRELLAAFDSATTFSRVAELTYDSEIAPLIDGRQVLMVVHFGQDFTANMLAGRSGALQVIVDGRNSNTAMLAINDVREIVDRYNRAWLADHGSSQPPARIETRAWFNPNLESRWFFLPRHRRHHHAAGDHAGHRDVGRGRTRAGDLSISCWSHRCVRWKS